MLRLGMKKYKTRKLKYLIITISLIVVITIGFTALVISCRKIIPDSERIEIIIDRK